MNGADGLRGEDGRSRSSIGVAPTLPDQIPLPGAVLFPEGIATTRAGHFFISSVATGQILEWSQRLVTPRVFAQGALAGGAVGLTLSEDEQTLWACYNEGSSLFAAAGTIAGFSLASGDVIATHSFPGGGFCNDVSFDSTGDLYATDSSNGRIMRVASADLVGSSAAEPWAVHPLLGGPGTFSLNGIAPAGSSGLYVVRYDTGELLRVNIQPNGSAATPQVITLPRQLAAPDGILALDEERLLVVEQNLGTLSSLTLGAQPALSPVRTGLNTPTTVAAYASSAWIVEGQVDKFFGFNPNPADIPFLIQRAPLPFGVLPLAPVELWGSWGSAECEAITLPDGSSRHLTRDYQFNDRDWALELTFFSDAGCLTPSYEISVGGPYELGGRTASSSATELDMGIAYNRLTARDAASVAFFTQESCGEGVWQIGVSQSVAETGCGQIASPISQCPTYHDIALVERDTLRLGARNGSLCAASDRPTTAHADRLIRR